VLSDNDNYFVLGNFFHVKLLTLQLVEHLTVLTAFLLNDRRYKF